MIIVFAFSVCQDSDATTESGGFFEKFSSSKNVLVEKSAGGVKQLVLMKVDFECRIMSKVIGLCNVFPLLRF